MKTRLTALLLTSVLLLSVCLAAPALASDADVTTDIVTEGSLIITVPSGWRDITTDSQRSNGIFSLSRETGTCMAIYSVTDMWNVMSAADRAGYSSREELNNDALTMEDALAVAASSGIAATLNDVSMATYDEHEFFFITGTYVVKASDGTSESWPVNVLIRLQEGDLHLMMLLCPDAEVLATGCSEIMENVKFDK